MKFIPHLVTASVIIILALASADFATTGRVDVVGTSVAVSLPLACAVLFRLACRAPLRPAKPAKRK